MLYDKLGSAKANGREPKTGLGQFFNYKFGCFDDVHVLIYADAHPHLQFIMPPESICNKYFCAIGF